jgi:hypothetical protein
MILIHSGNVESPPARSFNIAMADADDLGMQQKLKEVNEKVPRDATKQRAPRTPASSRQERYIKQTINLLKQRWNRRMTIMNLYKASCNKCKQNIQQGATNNLIESYEIDERARRDYTNPHQSREQTYRRVRGHSNHARWQQITCGYENGRGARRDYTNLHQSREQTNVMTLIPNERPAI